MQMTLGEIPLEEMKEVWYGEGFEEGEAKGMSKGISQGISQGIVQQKEADLRKFLIMYHDVENASKLFDMPFENVKEIADRLGH